MLLITFIFIYRILWWLWTETSSIMNWSSYQAPALLPNFDAHMSNVNLKPTLHDDPIFSDSPCQKHRQTVSSNKQTILVIILLSLNWYRYISNGNLLSMFSCKHNSIPLHLQYRKPRATVNYVKITTKTTVTCVFLYKNLWSLSPENSDIGICQHKLFECAVKSSVSESSWNNNRFCLLPFWLTSNQLKTETQFLLLSPPFLHQWLKMLAWKWEQNRSSWSTPWCLGISLARTDLIFFVTD